jgi:glycosyltransferase involved in cell wall biosynthesis
VDIKKTLVLLITNIERFPSAWTSSFGHVGSSAFANSKSEFMKYCDHADAIFVVDCDPQLSFKLASALWFRKRPKLVSVDLVLRRPYDLRSKIGLIGKRLLLRRFNHHIHYFRDLSAYNRVYEIGPKQSSFVPFKPNLSFVDQQPPDGNGKYVLCFGQSMRDFDTFFDAIETLEYPAAIPEPDFALLQKHGSRFTRSLSKLPPNVSVLDDDKSGEAQKQMIRDARLIVLPILKASMVASGIGTSLNSMLAGKCVIGTEGPGMSDIFTNEMLLVPPEDPQELARMIRKAWEDEQLRRQTAEAGQRLAISLGGEPELYQRIIDAIVNWATQRNSEAT